MRTGWSWMWLPARTASGLLGLSTWLSSSHQDLLQKAFWSQVAPEQPEEPVATEGDEDRWRSQFRKRAQRFSLKRGRGVVHRSYGGWGARTVVRCCS